MTPWADRQSFAFETTLAGLAYARRIPEWRAAGFRVELFFLALASPDMAVARVAERVHQGGHDIPEAVIHRRFAAGARHFEETYRRIVDAWVRYDNSGERPQLIDWGENP